jgi:hypothetical protein
MNQYWDDLIVPIFIIKEEICCQMKYFKSQMKQLVKENKELQAHLKELINEHDLEKNFALKALYHSEVADGGKYQTAYQALDVPKE